MSVPLETPGLPRPEVLPRVWAWRIAVVAPLVLAVPWLVLCRGIAERRVEPIPSATGLYPWEMNGLTAMGTLRGLLLVLLLFTATVTDVLRRRIYNWTTYTALGWVVLLELLSAACGGETTRNAGSMAATVVSALGMLPWRESLAGFVAGFAILFLLYSVFRGGAGDLKLIAVLGALVGINRIIEVLIYSYILAGIFAACLIVAVAGPMSLLAFAARSIGLGGPSVRPSSELGVCLQRQVPMAPFVAGGTLLALIAS